MKTKELPEQIDPKSYGLEGRRTLTLDTDLSDYLNLTGLNIFHVEAMEDSSCFRVSWNGIELGEVDGNIKFTRAQVGELADILEANFLNVERVRLTRDNNIEIVYMPDEAEWEKIVVPKIRDGPAATGYVRAIGSMTCHGLKWTEVRWQTRWPAWMTRKYRRFMTAWTRWVFSITSVPIVIQIGMTPDGGKSTTLWMWLEPKIPFSTSLPT